MPSYLYILAPQQIPGSKVIRDTLRPELQKALLEASATGPWKNNEDAARALSLVLPAYKAQPSNFAELTFDEPDQGSRALQDDSIHDEYFEIRRLGGNAAEIYVHMVLKANFLLFQDAFDSHFNISADKLNLLDEAFSTLLCWTLGTELPKFPRVSAWVSKDNNCQSMLRWIRGHQLFAALTQGLITAFRELKSALQKGDEQQVAAAVDLAVLLLRGSGISLEFTGDFPSDDYNNIIRPSMAPPLMPDTFSGLLSTDHRYFVQSLREMKPLLDALRDFDMDYHQRIASAVATVYDSHKFVCDRLVGKSPSLMMATSSKKSGAEQIDKFKHLRLKVFESEKRPAATEITTNSR